MLQPLPGSSNSVVACCMSHSERDSSGDEYLAILDEDDFDSLPDSLPEEWEKAPEQTSPAPATDVPYALQEGDTVSNSHVAYAPTGPIASTFATAKGASFEYQSIPEDGASSSGQYYGKPTAAFPVVPSAPPAEVSNARDYENLSWREESSGSPYGPISRSVTVTAKPSAGDRSYMDTGSSLSELKAPLALGVVGDGRDSSTLAEVEAEDYGDEVHMEAIALDLQFPEVEGFTNSDRFQDPVTLSDFRPSNWNDMWFVVLFAVHLIIIVAMSFVLVVLVTLTLAQEDSNQHAQPNSPFRLV